MFASTNLYTNGRLVNGRLVNADGFIWCLNNQLKRCQNDDCFIDFVVSNWAMFANCFSEIIFASTNLYNNGRLLMSMDLFDV